MEIDRQQRSDAPASGARAHGGLAFGGIAPALRGGAMSMLPLLACSACMAPADGATSAHDEVAVGISLLTAQERRERAGQIRDAALVSGMTQGYLLAGIADAETSMSHCWSELTWACMGPASPDCGGGPVVAGAGDGPCEIEQGGLGMFQFDAGTYAQTLAREGERVLHIDGNVQAAVDFVVSMLIRSVYVDGVDDAAQAIEWSNGVRPGNERWDPWIRTVTHYYNGCTPSASCWGQRYGHYLENTSSVHDEMGPDFWTVARDYAADYVEQTFPLASQPFELQPDEQRAGHIELRNTGSASWTPGETFLGTSEPRDGESALAADDWVSPIRAATIDRVVAPGETGRFAFSVRAPSAPGDYPQFFNLVQEGVAWFGDQGGPPDDQLQVRVTVVPGAAPSDAGGTDAGGTSDAGSTSGDCTDDDPRCMPPRDAGGDDGSDDEPTGEQPDDDGGSDAGGDAGVADQDSDDGCSAAPGSRRGASGWLVLALYALAVRIRRRAVAARPTRAWRGLRRARGSWS